MGCRERGIAASQSQTFVPFSACGWRHSVTQVTQVAAAFAVGWCVCLYVLLYLVE